MKKLACLLALVGLWVAGPSAYAAHYAGPAQPMYVGQADCSMTVSATALQPGPTNEDIAKAVLKSIGALALHEAGKDMPGDPLATTFARALSRAGRDELVKSAMQDLSPRSSADERGAVLGLVILVFDGKLPPNQNDILNRLRQINPNMADAVEVTEFLIRLHQARQNRGR